MYSNILIPVAPDHPERLAEQLSVAQKLASDGARISVVAIIEAVPLYIAAEIPPAIFEQAHTEAKTSLEDALKGHPDVTLEVVHGHAPTMLMDKIKEDGNDLVVVRSHKPDLSDWFLGSTAGRVVRHAPCSVHVIR